MRKRKAEAMEAMWSESIRATADVLCKEEARWEIGLKLLEARICAVASAARA